MLATENWIDRFRVDGKCALITGASRGIGRATAEALAALGARVIVSSRNLDACEAVSKGIRERGGSAHAIACNVGRKEEVELLLSMARSTFGSPDILVCNAAVNPLHGPTSSMTDEAFTKTMTSNVLSAVWLCNAICPEMAKSGGGSVVLVSSIAGMRASTEIGTYGISKAALIALSKNLAAEWGPRGIRVNAVAPGLIKTDFAKVLWSDEAASNRRIAATPLRRLGDVDDIAGVIAFLSAPASGFITGHTLVADGGVLA
jgi:NAD(P)-dependent dehydrogenase (short-subunit alcohol dehydrogenase family)